MATQTGIFELSPLATGSNAATNVLAMVNVHDATQSPQGSLVKLTLAQLYRTETTAVTVSTPLPDIAQKWNAGGVTFTAVRVNVTDTASTVGSFLLDLQVGGVSAFNVVKNGSVNVGGSIAAQGNISTTTGTLGGAAAAISAPGPRVLLTDSTGSANNTRFDIIASGGTLLHRLVNDADSAATAWLTVVRALNVATSVTITSPSTTVTGALVAGSTLTAPAVSVSIPSAPRVVFNESAAAADNKNYDVIAAAGTMQFRFVNDADNSAVSWLSATRGVAETCTLVSIAATTISFSTNLFTLNGPITVGGLIQSTTGAVALTTAAGIGRTLTGYTNGVTRNVLFVGDNALEVGADSGSDIGLYAYNDAGSLLGAYFSGVRATQRVTFPQQLTASNGISVAGGIELNDAAATNRFMRADTNGVSRSILLLADNAAESGANAGSNLSLFASSDAGSLLGAYFTAVRATQRVTFPQLVTSGSANINAFEYSGAVFGFDGRQQSTLTASDALGARFRIGSSVANSTTIQGLEGGVYLDHTSGIVNSVFGVLGSVIVNGAGGSTTTIRAGNFGNLVNNGAVTTAVSVQVGGTTVQGGGAVTNIYGIRVSDITGGGTLNSAITTGRGTVNFGDLTTVSDGTAPTNAALIFAAAVSSASTSGGDQAATFLHLQTVGTTGTAVGVIAASKTIHTSGTVAGMEGITGQCTISGAGGTTTNARPVQAAGNVTNGTVTTMSMFQTGNPGLSGGGVITTLVGLDIGAITVGGTNFAIRTAGGRVQFGSLPTSAAGLASGDIWNNAGVVNIVP